MKVKRSKKRIPISTETNIAGRLKFCLIIGLIIFQLAVIIIFNTRYALVAKGFAIFSGVVSLLTCVYILSTNKNGQSKAVWIIFLLTCFTFAYGIFWLGDARVLFKNKKRYKASFNAENLSKTQDKKDYPNDAIKQTAGFLYSTGKFLSYTNCKQEYFSSGEDFWQDLLENLQKAKEFIFIEFFIIADGFLLNKVFDILEEKIKSGVEVRIIYDDLGCKKTFSAKSKKALLDIGVNFKPFNKVIPIFSVAQNYRDHRKIVVIDGKIAYTGGVNLADEYINQKTVYGYWKDMGVRLEGNAVNAFTLMFLRQWEVLSKTHEDYSKFLNKHESFESEDFVIPYADGLEYEHPIARGVYENMITSANKILYIMTPYFIVDDGITSLLINKALSGVDVRIILPSIPDKKFVYKVSRSNAEKLIDYGVKVYTANGTFVHSKLMLTEDGVAIGSVNLDLRSFYQQFESALYTNDKKVLSSVYSDFSSTLENSEQITSKTKFRKNPFYRIFVGIIQLFSPLF